MCDNIYIQLGTGTTIAGTRVRSGMAEERRKSARNRKIVVDAVRESGETRVDRGKNVERKGWFSRCQPR